MASPSFNVVTPTCMLHVFDLLPKNQIFVSTSWFGLSTQGCFSLFAFFNLMSTYPICKYLVISHCCFSLNDILLFCVCPFLLFLPFSSLLSTSASSALHMGMIVCTPFHLFEYLIFTQFISHLFFQFEAFHVFPLPLPSINHLFSISLFIKIPMSLWF